MLAEALNGILRTELIECHGLKGVWTTVKSALFHTDRHNEGTQ